jgi:acetyl-CoA decarbonylase/synthase complex subunit delta
VAFEVSKEKNAGKIIEITLGASAENEGTRSSNLTIGSNDAWPFHFFEMEFPQRPVVAMEVFDRLPARYPEPLLECYGDVIGKPAAMAKKCVESYVRFIPQLIQNGANVLGGCCGTNPGYIERMAERIKEFSKKEFNPDFYGVFPRT